MTKHLASLGVALGICVLAVTIAISCHTATSEVTPNQQIKGTWIVTSVNPGVPNPKSDASFFESLHVEKLAYGLVYKFEDTVVVVSTGEGFEMNRGSYALSSDGTSLSFRYRTNEQEEYIVQFKSNDSLLISSHGADGKQHVLGFRRSKS